MAPQSLSTPSSWLAEETRPDRGVGSFELTVSERNVENLHKLWVSWILTLRCFTSATNFDIYVDRSKQVCFVNAIDASLSAVWSSPLFVQATDPVERLLEHVRSKERNDATIQDGNLTSAIDALENGPLLTTSLCRSDEGHSLAQTPKMMNSDIEVTITTSSTAPPRAVVHYRKAQISSELSRSILHTFCHLWESVEHNLLQTVENINYCSSYDQGLMTKYTDVVVERKNDCLHDMALRFATITPDADAVCSWDGDLTYRELDELTSTLAHHFVRQGVRPESFVLSCFEKSKWAVVARLAVSKAGAAYVSINAADPPAYLHSVIQRTQTRLLLTTDKFLKQFDGLVDTIISLSEETISNLPFQNTVPQTGVHSNNACLVLFTSGSTGEPKGIIQEHGSYATAIREYVNILGLDASTRMFQYDHYASDISNNDYLIPLTVGGCCCVPMPTSGVRGYPDEIVKLNANITFMTPTDAMQFDPSRLTCLHTICIGGESVSQDLVAKWHGKARIVNQYGMSEVATCCVMNNSIHPNKEVNLGIPRVGAAWVVSPSNPEFLMPVGAVGEIVIEGVHLARGYLDAVCPKSASYLRKTPEWMSVAQPNRRPERMYLSGDLGKYNHDGTISHVGRKDTILKVNGERIDAFEVEHCARKCLLPEDMFVVGVLKPSHGKSDEGVQLAAYVCLKDDGSVDSGTNRPLKSDEEFVFTVHEPTSEKPDRFCEVLKAIEKVLRDSLPAFMVPTVFVQVNRMPRTRTNKTDRRKLYMLGQVFFENNSLLTV